MVTEKLNVKQIGSTRISVPRDQGSNTRGGENLLYLPKDTTVHLCMKYSVDIYLVIWFFWSYGTKFSVIWL